MENRRTVPVRREGARHAESKLWQTNLQRAGGISVRNGLNLKARTIETIN